jgi:glycogen debranching enzyme
MSEDLTRYESLILFDGSTFFVSQPNGDVEAGTAEGYVHDDVRHLSTWRLLVDGRPLRGITSHAVDYYGGRIVCTPEGDDPPYSVCRDRFVTEGVHEDVVVRNHRDAELALRLELHFDSDFADVMEIQQPDGPVVDGPRSVSRGDRSATLRYERDGFRRSTTIAFGEPVALSDGAAVFELTPPPHGEWETCIDVIPESEAEEQEPLLRCGSFGKGEPEMPLALDEWFARAPTLVTDDRALERTYAQSLLDLASLRIRPREVTKHAMPAGGIPWFMAVFGRDSIVAAFEAPPSSRRSPSRRSRRWPACRPTTGTTSETPSPGRCRTSSVAASSPASASRRTPRTTAPMTPRSSG